MKRLARTFASTSTVVLAFACGTPAVVAPQDPSGSSSAKPARLLRERVANEVDPGPQRPFWPTVPADVRADIERSAKASKEPKERLQQAKQRLATWSFDFAGAKVSLHADALRACFEGVYLAEPLALATDGSPENIEAAALLARLYGVLEDLPWYVELFRDFYQQMIPGRGHAASSALAANFKPLEALATVAKATRPHLLAKVLRAGAPPEALAQALLDVAQRASRAGDIKSARELYAEYMRLRGNRADVTDYIAVARAERRALDRTASEAAAKRAHALAGSPAPAKYYAKLAAADDGVRNLAALEVLADKHDLVSELRRFDLLMSLEREDDCRVLAASLSKEHPADARVLVRTLQVEWKAIATHGRLVESAVAAAKLLENPRLTNKEGDYYSMHLGVLGMRIAHELLPLLARKPELAAQPLRAGIEQLRAAATGLAAFEPGRAYAILFVIDHLVPLVEDFQKENSDGLVKAMQGWLPDAMLLRAKFPNVPEIDRLVLSMASLSTDRATAFGAVLSRPKVSPEEDPALYLQRARTAVMLAAQLASGDAVVSARKVALEVPILDDKEPDAEREALLGDIEAVDARMKKDPKLIVRAREHYELARRNGAKEVRARATHNLGIVLHMLQDEDGAEEMLLSAAAQESPRRWLSILGAIMLPSQAHNRAESLRALAEANRAPKVPPYPVSAWLASQTADPAESARAAKEALDELDGVQQSFKTGAYKLGIDSEGTFVFGLGTSASKGHELKVQAQANLWLMHELPLSRAELEAKAKAAKSAAVKTMAKTPTQSKR